VKHAVLPEIGRQAKEGMNQTSCATPLRFRLWALDVRCVVEVEEHEPRGQSVELGEQVLERKTFAYWYKDSDHSAVARGA
jgi:hypothetical protein